jgi:hypothetical protein
MSASAADIIASTVAAAAAVSASASASASIVVSAAVALSLLCRVGGTSGVNVGREEEEGLPGLGLGVRF